MRNIWMVLILAVFVVWSQAQPIAIDLSSLFDRDIVVETGGSGLTDPLDENRGWIDGGTLPSTYVDGAVISTQDGRASFQFAPLKRSSLDGVTLNGQTLDVPDGRYDSLDLAMLAAPGGFGNPFNFVELRYADGATDQRRFGPVAGWFNSPGAYENTKFNYTDSSDVDSIVSFSTNFGDEELFYVLQERGNGNSGGNRFVDASGFVLYVIEDIPTSLTQATLGVTVGNNFVISLSAEYWDPEASFVDGYTVVANSMELYDGFEHRALGNLKLYEFDVSPFLAQKTGELYILLTDATPQNGWGPFLQNISLYSGENRIFEETLAPAVDTSHATVYAMFQTNGGDGEAPYLYDNSGSGPSNREHRFADAGGSITYRFDLPDTVTDAKLTVDMANNFVVSLSGPTGVVRYDHISPGAAEEKNYLIDEGNSILGGGYRFADASSYMVYQFDLPDELTSAVAQISVGNQFLIEAAAGTDGAYQIEYDWVGDSGQETRDNSNFGVYEIQLDPYLRNNPQNIVRFRFSDGQPADGWGPYLTGITIVNQSGAGADPYTEALNAMEMFGDDVHNEYNKNYYTIDLGSVLQANNPAKEVYVKFTDGSAGDGWGPGIFWMAVYTGEIDILSDRLVFNDLKATNGEPANYCVALLHRRYDVDATKTLSEIVLPQLPSGDELPVYLLGATLNASQTAVEDWMIWERH
ncbi:MAG: hypothetical protein C4527_04395 [Candidatus Omnitrophota bacterium]|nr:MAG: hypothetical protein C4527_04395 [Candidatus Omnitrophota bacterium]